MKVIIFNDAQNFNGSLDLLNSKYKKSNKKFWDYHKCFSFLVNKINSLDKFKQDKWTTEKIIFYTGKYNSKLLENLKWSCNQKISLVKGRIEREQWLSNFKSDTLMYSSFLIP